MPLESQDLLKNQQELLPIEKEIGNDVTEALLTTGNLTHVIGGATNTYPQAWIDDTGRQVPKAVVISKAGITVAQAGTPLYKEIDNFSTFPTGNYNLTIGNRFSVNAGGGGILLESPGRIEILSETGIIKIGGFQIVQGADDIQINGTKNVSIVSENLNLTSPTQVLVNSNLGVCNNLLVQGGTYINGELVVNHITAPSEIQQTICGFTSQGAYGFLKQGALFSVEEINGTIDTCSFGCLCVCGGSLRFKIASNSGIAVELTPHAHEFPNLPLTLTNSSIDTREAATGFNSLAITGATGLQNGPKVSMPSYTPLAQVYTDSSRKTSVVPTDGSVGTTGKDTKCITLPITDASGLKIQTTV